MIITIAGEADFFKEKIKKLRKIKPFCLKYWANTDYK